MTDAPRLSPVDELSDRIAHAPLFMRVKSRPLRTRLEEAVRRMSGIGENAESEYQRALAALRDVADEAIDALGQEFEALGTEEHVNRWAVVQLLSDLENPRALATLDKIIASPLPEEGSTDPHGSAAARELVVRTTAVEAVSRLAVAGSVEARAALLKVRAPLRSLRKDRRSRSHRSSREEAKRARNSRGDWRNPITGCSSSAACIRETCRRSRDTASCRRSQCPRR